MKLMDDKNRAANFAALFAYVMLNSDDVHPDNITRTFAWLFAFAVHSREICIQPRPGSQVVTRNCAQVMQSIVAVLRTH